MKPLRNDRLCFETERFSVVLLSPTETRGLMEVLLQDESLAVRVPWLYDKSRDGALREAFVMGLQAAAGVVRVWSIISRDQQAQVGAMIARSSPRGIDVDALVASPYWHLDVVQEASEPLIRWLEDNTDIVETIPPLLH